MTCLGSIVAPVRRRYQRTLADHFGRRVAVVSPGRPIVSFTFDDFPRSALHQGGAILLDRGFAGTYFASFGLMGQSAPTGEIFSRADLDEFQQRPHELACHTFDHCHSWDTPPSEFEASILRNRQAVARLLPGVSLQSLSYPISCPRPQTKRRTAKYYCCARGGGQTFNAGITDLNYLKAFFIEQSRDNIRAIEEIIDANQRANGWLIFATHDVCESPTRFGCTPCLFEHVVDYAAKSGATVLPVYQAWQQISLHSDRSAGRSSSS
jgi:peptidoglycan/xylan/chitin deacetylase (PgdA/CDA1 family)